MFRKLLKAANLLPSRGCVPRLHDFRHYAEFRTMPSKFGGPCIAACFRI
jgi:hypothetical protein